MFRNRNRKAIYVLFDSESKVKLLYQPATERTWKGKKPPAHIDVLCDNLSMACAPKISFKGSKYTTYDPYSWCLYINMK